MPTLLDLKILPLFASLVAGIVLGRAWFSRAAFGPVWWRLLGTTEADMKAEVRVRAYLTVIAANLVTYAALALLLGRLGVHDTRGGLALGALVGVAFVLAMTFVDDAFVRRPARLSLLNGGFHAVQLAIAGAIMGGWQDAPF